MYAMFQGASFVSLDISNFNMTNVVDTQGMFNVLDELRELKLGTNCRFPDDTGLPDIPITSEYTGKWQNIDTGTATKPNGAFVFASNELESYYDGATMVGTYVWQPRPLDVSQPVKAADVTVNYLDSNGNKIHDPQLISGNVGDAYDASSDVYQLKIDGYTLDESKLPTNVKGVLSDTPQSINYHYIEVAQPVKAADVTVNYLDSNGNKIHDPQLISGNVGDAYDASSDVYQLKIDGYTLDESKLPTNVKGVLSDTPQTVDYTYKKDTLATTLNDSKIAPSGQSKFGNLPNAGDNDLISVIAMISGLFVMIGLWISKQVKQRYK
ncbi:hypothetical protein EQJ87_03780 [Lactococcus kimchii]|nr:hypothetical protein EQJ87_03780 [Lactococcus sp. S-13]